MSQTTKDSDILSPAPEVLRDFCLVQLYPMYLFRYSPPVEPLSTTELSLCGLVHARTPVSFCVQLDADRRKSDRTSFSLSQHYNTAEKNARYAVSGDFLHPGIPVAARYMCGEDLRWYRAIIVDVDRTPGKEKPIRIRFVDFGNFQQNDLKHLRMMPASMGKDAPLAITCRLKGLSEDEDLPKSVVNGFANWAYSTLKELRCLLNFCGFDSTTNQHIVRVFDASDGKEFLLPPEYKSGTMAKSGPPPLPLPRPRNPDGTIAVSNLVSIDSTTADESKKCDSAGDSSSKVAAPPPPICSASTADLKHVFADTGVQTTTTTAGQNNATPVSAATAAMKRMAVTKKKKKRERDVVNKTVQTDVSMSGSAVIKNGVRCDPFEDERFKGLQEKYPNLINYLRYPF